jgi:hypothetical protein
MGYQNAIMFTGVPAARGIAGGVVGGVPKAALAEAVDVRQAGPATKLAPELAKLTGTAKIRVQIFLKSTDAATLTALKQLGVEILAQPKSAKIVIGRISTDKLQALSKLAVVTWVAPAP